MRSSAPKPVQIKTVSLCLIVCLAGCMTDSNSVLHKPVAAKISLPELALVERPALEAQSLDDDFHMSIFARAVKDAVLDLPALTEQRARLRNSSVRRDIVASDLRPKLTSSLSANQDLLNENGMTSTNARLTLRQLLFDGSATRNRIAIAEVNETQARFEMLSLASSLSNTVAMLGLEIWRQNQLVTLAQENLDAHQSFLNQTEERVESGVIPESDLFSARSRLADAQSRIVRARSAASGARASYAAFVGKSPPPIKLPISPGSIPQEVARERIASSSQMQELRLRLLVAERRRDVVLAERYPGVFVEMSGVRSGLMSDNADSRVLAGLSVDQSIFSGGAQRAREIEAQSDIEVVRRSIEQAERQLLSQLETALTARQSAILEAKAAADSIRFNAAALSAVQEQFAIGRSGITDILDAQRDLTDAKTSQLSIKANQIAAELNILELTGDLAKEFGIELSKPLARREIASAARPQGISQQGTGRDESR